MNTPSLEIKTPLISPVCVWANQGGYSDLPKKTQLKGAWVLQNPRPMLYNVYNVQQHKSKIS